MTKTKHQTQKQRTLARTKTRSSRPDTATASRFKDYVLLNLAFGAFCVVQMIFVRVLLRDFAGLYFFFGFIMCAFLIASVFDYIATRTDIGVPAEDNA